MSEGRKWRNCESLHHYGAILINARNVRFARRLEINNEILMFEIYLEFILV